MASLSGKDSTKQHVSRFGSCVGSSEVSCSKVGGSEVYCSKVCNLSRAQSTVAGAEMSGQPQSDVTAAPGAAAHAAHTAALRTTQHRQHPTPHQGHGGSSRLVRRQGADRRCYACGAVGHISKSCRNSCQRSRDGRRGNPVGHKDTTHVECCKVQVVYLDRAPVKPKDVRFMKTARSSRPRDVNYSPSRYVNYSPSGRLKGPAIKCTPIWPRAESWCNCT